MVFKFVFRNFKKRLFLNLIKVIGLALGLSGILFISLFLKNELTYDRFHTNANRIYRFTIKSPNFLNNQHFARIYNSKQVPALANYFPEIENSVRLAEIKGGVIIYNKKYYAIKEAFESDSTFFKIFDADLVIGDKTTVLDAPASMVVSESFAKKVFGKDDPIGQIISLPAGQFYDEKTDFTINGVMKDFPQNSHFHPDLISTPAKGKIESWAYTYLLLKNNAKPEKVSTGYTQFLAQLWEENPDKIQVKAYLQKLTDIHLHSDKLREIEPNGNMTNIYLFAIAALILLLISMSNYASLNLGMAGFNSKFIAINRVLGSTRRMNLRYFIIESIFIVSLSIAISIIIALPMNVFINNYFGIDLFKGNGLLIVLVIFVFALLGVFSGLQPVLRQQISNFSLNGSSIKLKKIKANSGILITQYSFAIILLISVIVISRQTNFVLNNSMGSKEDNVIILESVHAAIQEKFEIFKSEILKHNSIASVSAMFAPPGGETNDMFAFEIDGVPPSTENEEQIIDVFPCDYSFANLFQLTFLGGENFTKKNKDVDGSGEYIINETAMKSMGFKNANQIVGKNFKLLSPVPEVELPEGKIIGVVKDFHLSSLRKKVEPLVMFKREESWLSNFAIAYEPKMKETALTDIQKVWTKMFPAYPFSYEHVDTMYRNVYKTELLQSNLLSIFTFISLFITSIGLLGMSLLISQQRVKEIGIRKVNGAQVSEIMTLLNKNFIKWVFVAFIIATPIAYFAMNKWLENFAYKTTISWWIFALAGITALAIALLTVSWQSFRAAVANPVDALKDE